MSIVKMKKLRLIAVRSQRDDLMKGLMLLGCVQIREPEGMLADPDTAALLRTERTDLVELRARADELADGLRLLDHYAPAKSPLLARRPEVRQSVVLDEEALKADLELARRIRRTDEQIRAAASRQSAEKAVLESLQPWSALDYPLECPPSRTCAAAFGTLPAASALDQAADALEAAVEEAQIIHVSSDETQHCVLLIAFKDRLQDAMEALRPLGFSQVVFTGLTGTAKENIASLQTHLRQLEAQRRELTGRIEAEKSGRDELKLGVDRMSLLVARADAAERLRGTNSIVALEGWCPAAGQEALAEELAKYDCAWELSDPAPEEAEAVPVKLENGRFSRPLNMVTNMYSLPAYDGIDPNPLMAPFFVLFYGLMLADMGYGLLMILGGLLVLKKTRPKGGSRNFFELMLECGVSTFVIGALTGSCFGDAPYQFVHMLNENSTWQGLPALFTPLNDTIYVLVGSMVLGVIQILTGMIINIHMCARDGHLWDGIMDQGCWMLTFAGIAVGALTGFWWVAVAGVVAIVGTQGRNKKGVLGKIFGGLPALYNITGYLGDVLSYTRIMALMLAGSVIAQVFNTLAGMIGKGWDTPFKLIVGIVCFLIIFLFGNTLNFALNLLGCYVHDLRLQCLEFFGKFYKDGGKPFKPLNVDTKYVDIIKEDN